MLLQVSGRMEEISTAKNGLLTQELFWNCSQKLKE